MQTSGPITSLAVNKALFLLILMILQGMRFTSQCKAITFLTLMLTASSVTASQRVSNKSDQNPVTIYPHIFIISTLFPPAVFYGYYPLVGHTLILDLMPLETDQQGNQGEEYAFLLKQWNELFLKIREEEKLVQNIFRDATNAQFKASQQLRTAELNKKLTESDKLAKLNEAYEQSVLHLKEAKLRQKEVKKLLDKARKINSKPADLTEKKLTKTRITYNMLMARYSPERTPLPEPAPSQSKPQTPTQTSPQEGSQKKTPVPTTPPVNPSVPENKMVEYDLDMINTRPGQLKVKTYTSSPFDCVFESDSIDQASGLLRQAIQPSLMFTHTDPDLRPYFKDKELITCLGRLTKIGHYIYLTVEFQIASSHSQGNFGSLQNGSLLRFKLMNDEFVSLYNLKTNEGRIDPYSGYTVFSGQYALGKEEIKKLNASELDKMRVMWTTGYEDYDIYHLDFMINQLNCLKAKK